MGKFSKSPALIFYAALLLFGAMPARALKTQNVFLIVTDGFRWQEVFNGAEELLLTKENGGVADTNALKREFWRETPERRREALLPFVWGEIGRHGQIFGNQNKGSAVRVANGFKFSYPGYNEMLTGMPDPRVDSNAKRLNPNVTVFEWANGRPGLRGRTMVLATWDVFPYIFNLKRSHLPIWPAWEEKFEAQKIQMPGELNEFVAETMPPWDEGVTYDDFLFQAALHCMRHERPRLLFIGFGETDDWAHEGRYDRYLTAGRHVDDYVKQLWQEAQAIDSYRDKTTFIITADHGRGSGREDWKSHGPKIAGAENDWFAVMGPDTLPLGERTNTAPLTEGQLAATVAALLGEDYRAAFPQVAEPVADILGR